MKKLTKIYYKVLNWFRKLFYKPKIHRWAWRTSDIMLWEDEPFFQLYREIPKLESKYKEYIITRGPTELNISYIQMNYIPVIGIIQRGDIRHWEGNTNICDGVLWYNIDDSEC